MEINIKHMYDMFSDLWRFYKHHYSIKNKEDSQSWEKAVQDAYAFLDTYPEEMGKELLLVVLRELEREAGIEVKEAVL